MARILAEATGAARADVWLRAGPQLAVGASWPPDAPRPGPVALARRPPRRQRPPAPAASPWCGIRARCWARCRWPSARGSSSRPPRTSSSATSPAQVGLILRNVGLTEQLERAAGRAAGLAAADRDRPGRPAAADRARPARRRPAAAAGHRVRAGPGRVPGRAGRGAGAGPGRAAHRPAPALPWRPCAIWPAASTRRCWPTRDSRAAVSAHAGKAPLPVVVDADGVGRYPADVETAVYFCCVEAVQNAARHAPGATVRVRLRGSAGDVWFEVEDDGPGFDRSARAARRRRRAAAHGRPAGRARRVAPGRRLPRRRHHRHRADPGHPVTAPPGPGVPVPAGGAATSSPRPVAASPPEPAPA